MAMAMAMAMAVVAAAAAAVTARNDIKGERRSSRCQQCTCATLRYSRYSRTAVRAASYGRRRCVGYFSDSGTSTPSQNPSVFSTTLTETADAVYIAQAWSLGQSITVQRTWRHRDRECCMSVKLGHCPRVSSKCRVYANFDRTECASR